MSRHYKNPATRDGAHWKPVEGGFKYLPGKKQFRPSSSARCSVCFWQRS